MTEVLIRAHPQQEICLISILPAVELFFFISTFIRKIKNPVFLRKRKKITVNKQARKYAFLIMHEHLF